MPDQLPDGPIFVLGGGGHASDVLNVIARLGMLDLVAGCFDDGPDPWRMARWEVPYLGPITGRRLDGGWFVLGAGMPATKSLMLDAIEVGDAQPLTLVDPAATVSHGVEVGAGTVVLAGATIGPMAVLGQHCGVGQGAAIGHDTVLGPCCGVMPGAAVSGDCELGARVLVGTNAAVLQGVTIGADAVVGAGAVLTRNVRAGLTVVGAPARPRPA